MEPGCTAPTLAIPPSFAIVIRVMKKWFSRWFSGPRNLSSPAADDEGTGTEGEPVSPNKEDKGEKDEVTSTELSPVEIAKGAISSDPLNAENHFAFAEACEANGQTELAYSAYRTAQTMGIESAKSGPKIAKLSGKLPDQLGMDHNEYFRIKALADELLRLDPNGKFSLLDVGGGIGKLSQFLPDCDYCLAEPAVNGIPGTNLPFGDASFDYVVSCHVLEHIPPTERDRFLSEMARPARKAVILLNPFEVPGTAVVERLQLFIDLLDARWAKEHLECTLPTVEYVENWAKAQGYPARVQPSGTLTTTVAMVFANHYGQHSGNGEAVRKLNEFFNTRFMPLLDSADAPNAYLVTIDVGGAISD